MISAQGAFMAEEPSLGIEKLMSQLDHIKNDEKRISNKLAYAVLKQVRNELPYTNSIPVALIDSLLADAPQAQTNTSLNIILVNVVKALLNPSAKNEIVKLIQHYLSERKKTEKNYAQLVLDEVVNDTDLVLFPERTRPLLKELSVFVLEKVINEKQLRQLSDYRLQPLTELINSILYQKLFHIELEQLKIDYPLEFKKFIHLLVQDGYEKIVDETKLRAIQKEKSKAFNEFNAAIAARSTLSINLGNLQNKIKFIQRDQNENFKQFRQTCQELLAVISQMDADIASDLLPRFYAGFRKAFYQADQNTEIYTSEEMVLHIHHTVLKQVEDEVEKIIDLVKIVLSAEIQYKKSVLNRVGGKKDLQLIQEVILNNIFGKLISKFDPATQERTMIRVGGYPQKEIPEIYAHTIQDLQDTTKKISGFFSAKLKQDLELAIVTLQSASELLRTESHETQQQVQEIASPVITEANESSSKTARVETAEIPAEPTADIQEIPLTVIVEMQTEQQAEPKLEPESEPEAESEPEPQVEQSAAPTMDTQQASPQILTETQTSQTLAEATIESEEPELQDFHLEPVTVQSSESPINNITPNDDILQVSVEEPLQDKILISLEEKEIGLHIIKNYQLENFQQQVTEIWFKLIQSNRNDKHVSFENEIRLYEICNVVQQFVAVQKSEISDEKKSFFQEATLKLNAALKHPFEDENWKNITHLLAHLT